MPHAPPLSALLHRYSAGTALACDPVEQGLLNRGYRLRTTRGHYFLKHHFDPDTADPADIARQHLATRRLADLGVPVAPPLPGRDGRTVAVVGGHAYALHPWVDGRHRHGTQLSPLQCARLGALLGAVHAGLERVMAPEGAGEGDGERYGEPHTGGRERRTQGRTSGGARRTEERLTRRERPVEQRLAQGAGRPARRADQGARLPEGPATQGARFSPLRPPQGASHAEQRPAESTSLPARHGDRGLRRSEERANGEAQRGEERAPRGAHPVESADPADTFEVIDDLLARVRRRRPADAFDELARHRLVERRTLLARHADRRPPPGGSIGWVHGDFHPFNLLYRGDAPAAIVDWDRLCVQPRAEEAVRAAVIFFVRPDGTLDLARTRAYARAYRRAAGATAAQLAAAVHRVWWERLNDFWMLRWHYERGDTRADAQFPASSALVVWWTREYETVRAAFSR
ncbi:phosphotransferase [Streptomyces sp. bgisy154]|uniref:phosphotransferase n=1 Tax=Streptomyces sp. bgisy154 TaxID=3413794 RepID=UPI003D746EBB